MPASSNDPNSNTKANYSWKLAGGGVNDPLRTPNACSQGAGSRTAVTAHPRSRHRRTPRAGRWKNSGSSQSAVARMASSAPTARPRADAVGPVPPSGGSGVGTRTGPGSQPDETESGHGAAAARAAPGVQIQPASAWGLELSPRPPRLPLRRLPFRAQARGRPRTSPRSREPLKGGSQVGGLGQTHREVAAAARACGVCSAPSHSIAVWDLLGEDTGKRQQVKPPPG